MLQERISKVFEQTEFLVEKQKELLTVVDKIYTGLLNLISSKIKEESDFDIVEDLKAIEKNISEHYKNLNSDIKEDINFLDEQFKSISEIKNIKDDKKAEELLNMIVDQDDELVDTQEFKNQVATDLTNSLKELQIMSEDLANAINEGKAKELRLMLEAVQEHNHDLDEDGCDSDSCSSCSGCSHNEDVDLFELLKDKENK
ncbi:hypothetical protein KJ644_03170 [Candidatus Dependentiae bacterium]|nr:hypothetical protein [Candidatus Dependentiae bacterium]MBU4387447.1 hypothetical protein [Candidatus Dependentiae bacterium]MCG2756025.1 hypothetical protein [Candidatus Dependentiae bacterium]